MADLRVAELVRLIPALGMFDSLTESEVFRPDKGYVQLYYEMLQTNPIARAGVKARILTVLSLMGTYTHPNSEIQEFIQQNFKQISGSWQRSLSEMAAHTALGYAAFPLEMTERQGQWVLDRLVSFDPRCTTFVGSKGDITSVKYRGNNKTYTIPYENVLHISQDDYLTPDRNPYGSPECRTVLACWQAWKAVSAQLLLAAQNQATPQLHGKTDIQAVQLLDKNGNPLDGTQLSSELLLEKMQALGNTGRIVTDRETEITVLEGQVEPEFFEFVLSTFERLILLGFLTPETTFSVGRGGLGNVTLSEQHSDIFIRSCTATRDMMAESIVEKLACPLIDFNYGKQDTYGEFTLPEESAEKASEISRSIVDSISRGGLAAKDIDAAWEKNRQVLGLPESEELIDDIANAPNYDVDIEIEEETGDE